MNRIIKLLLNPGSLCFRSPWRRRVYKLLATAMLMPFKIQRNRMLRKLPPVHEHLRILQDRGFGTISSKKTALLVSNFEQLLKRCDDESATSLESTGSKKYLRNHLSIEAIKNCPEFLSFALDPNILAAVSEYIGELPLLGSVKLLSSVPDYETASGSQLYHCDHDDTRQVKLFLHVSDVDRESGPLHLIPAELSSEIKGHLNYRYGGNQGHVSDKEIFGEIAKDREVAILGKRGTFSLVDTSRCFHFGSRDMKKQRLVFYVQYLSPSNFLHNPFGNYMPKYFAKKLPRSLYADILLDDLNDVQKAVLKLS